MAWFWLGSSQFVLHLVLIDTSLQSLGQEKQFGIVFILVHFVICGLQLSVQTCSKG